MFKLNRSNLSIFIFMSLMVINTSCKKSSDSNVVSSNEVKTTTLEEIYLSKITTQVNKDVVIKSRVKWYNYKGSYSWPNDTSYASALLVYFETGDKYVAENFRGQDRANIRINSNKIVLILKDSLRQSYSFGTLQLDTNSIYLLAGKIQYRSNLKVDSTKLNDSLFINQSNNCNYWSQTFQFDLQQLDMATK